MPQGRGLPDGGKQLAELAQRNGANRDLVDSLRGAGEVNGPNAVMEQLSDHLGGRPRE